jgi:predicted CoA-binding protein
VAGTHLTTDDQFRLLLASSRNIALIGASEKPWRDSNRIMQYLLGAGYRVVPVNPRYTEVLGVPCVPSLREVPEAIDIVNVFRRPDEIMPIIDDAVAVRARSVWMQEGVINDVAARRALEGGCDVVMDRCIMVYHRLLVASSPA